MWDGYWTGRGAPWESDPGPRHNRSWARLFAETPNYRGLGWAVTGREVFRWHFGPVFYRGRLGDGQVKVIVVGQEGAQDESLAHRAFVGGTGARLQHLLNHLGITRSYLFLNTFVYPIFGQYVNELRVIAQHPHSPICRHRNRILDYAAARNDLHLAIAVGTAAKESLATWVTAHGGSAHPGRLHEADATVISPGLRMVGVLHPGGAATGALASVVTDFRRALEIIQGWSRDDPAWLPPDSDGHRNTPGEYRYEAAAIPFGDLPYGVPWRLGRGGTSSNRREGQSAIQLFSVAGTYNNAGHELAYAGPGAGSESGYAAEPGDLAYEPPRALYRRFDRGPGPGFDRLLQGCDPALPWPDFAALGLQHNASFGHGPIYRGRLDRPALLVLGDQSCHDDLFSGRAMTGDDGQHLHALLRAAGVTENYGILRVLPVDTRGEPSALLRRAIDHPHTRPVYREAIRRAQPQVIVAAGPLARRLVESLGLATPVVEMESHGGRGWLGSWRKALSELAALRYRRDLSRPSFRYKGEREQIPRAHLPYGTLRWQATSGDRAQRATRDGERCFDYYRCQMPAWAAALAPAPLSPAERAAVERMT